jgi:hypothetical protein
MFEAMLESKLNPLVALGKTGILGTSRLFNQFNGDAELLDDLVSHTVEPKPPVTKAERAFAEGSLDGFVA